MKREEIDMLLELRNLLIRNYQKLDRDGQPTTSVMLQKDTAKLIEQSMSKLDEVLCRHVKIEGR